jgi:Tol biopolymer transport system component
MIPPSMPLTPGSRLGPYEILSPLGAGGMGEVYRARDSRLDRSVAIKVLPPHLSSSPEVRQRFEREAKTISQLSHPHICALYDVGREGETEYLVMELLEGETLSDRLIKGGLPLEQTFRYGVEIADALDKAHRQGIVHRDLKPGNVMITRSGVKLLDFGLAKAAALPERKSGLTSLPTVAGANLTQEGTILGTFQYMAPEQLEGREADARSDIFALGAVLYEMATGKKAFAGDSQASIITAIMRENPAPISTVEPLAPPALDRLVSVCLAKDPEERWQSAADVRRELRWIAEGSHAGVSASSAAIARRRPGNLFPWIALLLVSAAGLWSVLAGPRRAPDSGPVFRSSILLPEKVRYLSSAISPDGTRLVVAGQDAAGSERLWLRRLDAFQSEPISGTEHAALPFWSPDGRYIAFFADGKLKRIEPSGGSALPLCDSAGVGGAWGPGGDVIFAEPTGPIYRLSPAGGKPVAITKLDETRHETSHRYPAFLPDGKHFLYTALNLAGSPLDEGNRLYVGSIDGAPAKPLMPISTNTVFSQGYLLYMVGGVSSGSLLAQAFDPKSFQIRGEPLTVAEAISANIGYFNLASFTVSSNGVLAYDSALLATRLQWLDRDGRLLSTFGEVGRSRFLRISPDGSRIAFAMYDTGTNKDQVWIGDAARGTQTRLTSGDGENGTPVWSPDGSRVAFRSDRKHQSDLYVKAASGAGDEEALSDEPGQKVPEDWSRDGQYILFFERSASGNRNPHLSIFPVAKDRKPFVLYPSLVDREFVAAFSPDGRWVAFANDESGRTEVYAVSFPDGKRKIQISNGGGDSPRWRADGKELFYAGPGRRMMAVDIQPGEDLKLGTPRALFSLPGGTQGWDVAPDGKRFLINVPVVETNAVPLNLVVNWTAQLGMRK